NPWREQSTGKNHPRNVAHPPFDPGSQTLCGEYTFEMNHRCHEIVIEKRENEKISFRREYRYRSGASANTFTGKGKCSELLSDPAPVAQLALQLYLCYLTDGLFKLLNDTVREKFFVRTFPQREKFCASMPICSGVRGKSTRKLLRFRGCSENLVFIPQF